ncbi:NACHT, LRR and PYD domains-containing protein 1 homolog isoform X2 [Ctenopharyngodon idella]|nr:NACHT, LRR and PYD domains-containing protein 1 homolog isoform X2 [Ctenopharyngodon idella]XP_051756523.1 NACHT, LRR and PYD domains-containing protein 1 homolog isoform X2 [Ctenopharyngodon idella]
MNDYKPCGPLMDITVTSGTLKEVHLPHFICVDSVSSSDNAVKALHVKGSEVSLERCELTRFHAKLLNPTFSFWGVIAQFHQYFSMKFHCETLIYRTRTPALKLHVYLILKDPKLEEEVEKTEDRNMRIVKPKPNKALKMNDCYTLKTSCDSTIKPPSLNLTTCKANFFDVHIKDAKECIELHIMTKEDKKIWDVNIESDEFNSSVSDSLQSTSPMTGNRLVHEILLEHLENLTTEELEVFKWHLTEGVAAFKKTPKCKLETAGRCDIVTCMIDQHGVDGAAKLTMTILRKLLKNNDAKQLQEKLDIKD